VQATAGEARVLVLYIFGLILASIQSVGAFFMKKTGDRGNKKPRGVILID
jgi:hypothetical protein